MTTRPRGSTVEAEQQGAGRLAIPEAGLREYWYPAARAKDVPRARPLEVRLLGEDLVLFRAPGGSVGAIDAVCPHRGGRIGDEIGRASRRERACQYGELPGVPVYLNKNISYFSQHIHQQPIQKI